MPVVGVNRRGGFGELLAYELFCSKDVRTLIFFGRYISGESALPSVNNGGLLQAIGFELIGLYELFEY